MHRAARMLPVRTSGTVLCLASACAFGAMGVFGKLAYENGATVGTLLSVRFPLAALLFWALGAAPPGPLPARAAVVRGAGRRARARRPAAARPADRGRARRGLLRRAG